MWLLLQKSAVRQKRSSGASVDKGRFMIAYIFVFLAICSKVSWCTCVCAVHFCLVTVILVYVVFLRMNYVHYSGLAIIVHINVGIYTKPCVIIYCCCLLDCCLGYAYSATQKTIFKMHHAIVSDNHYMWMLLLVCTFTCQS